VILKKPSTDWLAVGGIAIAVISLVLAVIIVVKLIEENVH